MQKRTYSLIQDYPNTGLLLKMAFGRWLPSLTVSSFLAYYGFPSNLINAGSLTIGVADKLSFTGLS